MATNSTSDSPAGFSPCCYLGEGDICLSDGLCYWPTQPDGHGNYVYRAACTDKSWTDSACPQVCTVDDPNHFETVSFCPNTTDFCCAKSAEGDCCQHANLRFNLTIPAYVFADLRNGSAADVPATSTFSQAPTAAATGGTSTSANTISSAAASSKPSLSAGAAAGIAVAAILVVIGIAVGTFVFWWRRRRTRAQNDAPPADHGKPEIIESRSISGLEVATGSIHNKSFDSGVEVGSPRDSRRKSSSAISPTQSRNTSVALGQVALYPYSQDGNPIVEEEEPGNDVYEAYGHGPTSEAHCIEGRHVGPRRYELGDGHSTRS